MRPWMCLVFLFSCRTPTEPVDSTDTSPTADTATTPLADTSTTTSSEQPMSLALNMSSMLGHLDALQAIADDQSANRSLLTEGYAASADYVEARLLEYGYEVRRESFVVNSYTNDVASFAQLGPTKQTFVAGTDFLVSPYSGNGAIAAPVVAVDVVVPPGAANASTSGCETSDFAAFPAGAVALIQRGTCAFITKYNNAVAAEASAVVFFNEGQKGRTAPIAAQIGVGALGAVPSIGASYSVGEALAGAKQPTVSLEINGGVLVGADDNLFAETPGDPNRVVMVGAHLDSVLQGPGINDNGSGTAFVLELARLLAQRSDPTNQVRLAWWGAEEGGLLGSAAWLTHPKTGYADPAKLGSLKAYLNFDMMASLNGARFVYDGDASHTTSYPYSLGNAAIEDLFEDWFAGQGQPTVAQPMLLASDSFWFVLNGVPTGGVFSGAGAPFDACYHQLCDTRSNVNETLFEELARGSAHVVETLADDATRGVTPSLSVLPGPLPMAPVGCHDHASMPL